MSRYTNVDALKQQVESPYTEYPIMIQIRKALKDFIDEAPSIDIVFCKECTHWDRAIDESGIERFNFSKCVKGHHGNGFDFYCADGER